MASKGLPAVLVVLIGCCATARADQEFSRLRDCGVWIRQPAGSTVETVRVDWEAGASNDSTINYIYFQAPDGRLIEADACSYGDPSGSDVYHLTKGAGDYKLEFAGYFWRKAKVIAQDSTPIMLEPVKGHVCMMGGGANSPPLYFDVPVGTASFTLCGLYANGPDKIDLYDPSGALYDTLALSNSTQTLYFDRLQVNSPATGAWRIEIDDWGKIGFWVDGVDNLFALSPANLFTPDYPMGFAIHAGSCGKTARRGLIGGFLEINPGESNRILNAMAYMGMETLHYWAHHHLVEPYNPAFPEGGDNGDPNTFDPFGWDFGAVEERMGFYHDLFGVQISTLLTTQSGNGWLGKPLTLQERQEFGEFALAYVFFNNYIRNRNLRWFSVWHEPNLSAFTYDQYEDLIVEVAGRLKDPCQPAEVRNTPILAINSGGFECCNEGFDRLGGIWADNLYSDHDDLVDGIAINYWESRDLIESWRFGNVVDIAADIIKYNDSDGQLDEEIIVNMTSMSGGNASSAYEVNTHFGALWLAGAICHGFSRGDLDALHYSHTTDDDHHMKGLIYGENPPSPLPYQAQAAPYQIKPIGHAMAMANAYLLDDILETNPYYCVDVDSLLTVNLARDEAGLLVVNDSRRQYFFVLDAKLPAPMRYNDYKVTGIEFGPQMSQPQAISGFDVITANKRLRFFMVLEPQTVYAFNFDQI